MTSKPKRQSLIRCWPCSIRTAAWWTVTMMAVAIMTPGWSRGCCRGFTAYRSGWPNMRCEWRPANFGRRMRCRSRSAWPPGIPADADTCLTDQGLAGLDNPIGPGSGSFTPQLIEATKATLLKEAYRAGEAPPPAGSDHFTDLEVLERHLRGGGTMGDRTQWYLFKLPEESLIVVDAVTWGRGAGLKLFDYEGTWLPVAEVSGDEESRTTRMVRSLRSGTLRSRFCAGRAMACPSSRSIAMSDRQVPRTPRSAVLATRQGRSRRCQAMRWSA